MFRKAYNAQFDFLYTHYKMRKNVMTGVAQYSEKNGEMRFGKAQLKNVTPKKIGDTLGSRQFNFESRHTNSGTKYLMAER